jgi:hypothetical protein
MADKSFTAEVDEWVKATQGRMLAVFKKSAETVISNMQTTVPSGGNLPIDTGFLRKSLLATLNQPSNKVTFKDENVNAYTYNSAQVTMVIVAAKIGDTIYAVYTAAYAARMEYGFSGVDSLGRKYNQVGRGFVRLAAQRWQQVVDQVVQTERARRA